MFEVTTDYVRKKLPKIYSHELVSLIFELPYRQLNRGGYCEAANRFRLFEAAGGDWRFNRGHVLKRVAFLAPEVHEVTDD